MADTDVRVSRNEAKSYKEKLLQPSDQDELSVPDQPETPTVPPTKDEGSPPMTVPAEAPAGADESARDEHPTERGSTTETYTAPSVTETEEGKGANEISVPDTSDVTAVAGTELSDLEKEAISDPSTADLLAAATADDSAAAAAAANDAPVQTNVVTIQDEESSDVTAAAGDKKAPAAAEESAALPADSGVAAAYGHLQQTPAAADDPAAVPAAADPPLGSSSSDVAAGPMEVKPAELPIEEAVSADKDEEVVSDAAAGSAPAAAAAAEPDDGSSENPLAAAVEAVAQPVAAALTNLKDVFIGPDITLGGDSESKEDKQE